MWNLKGYTLADVITEFQAYHIRTSTSDDVALHGKYAGEFRFRLKDRSGFLITFDKQLDRVYYEISINKIISDPEVITYINLLANSHNV